MTVQQCTTQYSTEQFW